MGLLYNVEREEANLNYLQIIVNIQDNPDTLVIGICNGELKAIEFEGEEYEKEKRNIDSTFFGSRISNIYYCNRRK